jgi:hypothetical protein
MLTDFYFDLIDTRVQLLSVKIDHKNIVLPYILNLMYTTESNNNTNKFFCITQGETELSLFVPETVAQSIMQNMPGYTCSITEKYTVLRVFQDTHMIEESGVVSEIAKFFAERNIPILYVNSFNNNYILVRESDQHVLDEFIEY